MAISSLWAIGPRHPTLPPAGNLASTDATTPVPASAHSISPWHETETVATPTSRSPQPYYLFSGYIGEFTIVDDHRGGKIVVELTGRINKCGVISPRFDCQYYEIENWINNLLPSRQFGHVVLTTTYGIMDHDECRRKKTGGKVLGFFY